MTGSEHILWPTSQLVLALLAIRRAHDADVDALVELACSTFRETYELTEDPSDMDEYVTREFTPQVFHELLNDVQSRVLVMLEHGRYLGYAHLRQSPPPPCVSGAAPVELSRLYLRKATIGRGLGARLMREVLDIARADRFRTLWLVVYSKNERAREFYRRFGFVDVGIKDFYFGGRAYPDPVMARSMESPPAN